PHLWLGTSSFSENSWVGPFYPRGTKPGDYLRHYATRFDTVEIDATYYAIPSARTVDGWSAKTPDDFVFAAKFPRSIVHCGEGPRPRGDLVLTPRTYPDRDAFLNVMGRLGGKLGPLLIQFPYFNKQAFADRREFVERLDTFLDELSTDFRYAVEIRNRAWLQPDFMETLSRHNCALTLLDQAWMPHGAEFAEQIDPITTDFSYVRLIGDRAEIEAITETWDKVVIDRGESIDRWAELLKTIMRRDINVFAYINNHYAGHAPVTCEQLAETLAG
ncbi:MAG TPA: DUF72 domain-containing protein, partial [candidate division Zixibacteria bacterium]|nr:DUF72 domain-containing protein [candidate division Zixibacteria bacterium]